MVPERDRPKEVWYRATGAKLCRIKIGTVFHKATGILYVYIKIATFYDKRQTGTRNISIMRIMTRVKTRQG